MNNYSRRWAQLQQQDTFWAYDWRLVLTESLKLVIIGLMAWWMLVSLFPTN